MNVRIHPHAFERMAQRGVSEAEVRTTVIEGKQFPGKSGRTGFQQNFFYNSSWGGKFYATKQVIVFAVQENGEWLVVTVITKFFN
jgi:Domain of unknown function (DUF4258)